MTMSRLEFLLLCFLALLPPSARPFSFGGGKDKALYSPLDPGITLVNVSDFKSVVHGSKTAWMVEFYSSWCGHCIHFAPTFKHLASDVRGWSNVISIAAIDCADDDNLPICRNYEIMGYPSLKFFPPNANAADVGLLREGHSQQVEDIKTDMRDFVARVQQNKSIDESFTAKWPVLNPYTSDDLSSLFDSRTASSQFAIVIVHMESQTNAVLDAMMDFSQTTSKLSPPLTVRRVVVEKSSQKLLQSVSSRSFPTYPQLLVVRRNEAYKSETITPKLSEESNIRTEFMKALNEFVWRETKALSGPAAGGVAKKPNHGVEQSSTKEPASHPQRTTNEAEIKRRRYTVYMADLEKAMLYSLSHEVSQHATITGETLNALQDYVDTLSRFFPARHKTRDFLIELSAWIMGHDDAVRGADLATQVDKISSKLGAFKDAPKEWLGCAGSSTRYGGYPCGLWMMFHSMTARQAAVSRKTDKANTVLSAMKSFVEHFFGCRECARHFLQMAENGSAIDREVHSVEDALLWLWKAHNKVNVRLSGDISDDEVFPKERFPNRQHCSDCYNNRLAGSDGWREYRLANVKQFLKEMYVMENFSFEGLTVVDPEDKDVQRHHHEHGLIIPDASVDASRQSKFPGERFVDTANFGKKANVEASYFSDTDTSLMLFVYLISGALIVLACLRFASKRRFIPCVKALVSFGGRRSPYHTNPLLGKV